jgi:predicted AlkP superfamily phosphohydrolase/phosphomutase
MHTPHRKVYIIGIDGATWDILDPLFEQGQLPNLKKIRQQGMSGVLKSTRHPITPAAWTSMITGLSPGKHGIFDFRRRLWGSFEIELMNGGKRDGTPFWDYLSDVGLSVGIFNIPMTFPPESVQGFFVSGMDTPRTTNQFTFPKDLGKSLDAWVNGYRIDVGQGAANEVDYMNDILELQQKHVDVFRLLLEKYDPEISMGVFIGTDRMQHAFWKYWESAVETGTVVDNVFWQGLTKTYQIVDELIGYLQEKAGREGALVIVVSDHGFGPLHKDVYLNQWLADAGFLQIKPNANETSFWEYVDWENTRAYSFGYFGNIYLNLVGREPFGTVYPGKEAKSCLASLRRKLLDLRDPDSSGEMTDKVIAIEDIYSGPYINWGPDLFVVMKNYSYMTRDRFDVMHTDIVSPPMLHHPSPIKHSGNHRMDGIVLISGEGVIEGGVITDASVLDLVPTLLHSLDIPLPKGLDGQVWTEIWDQNSVCPKSVNYGPRTPGISNTGTLHSMATRLKILDKEIVSLKQQLDQREEQLSVCKTELDALKETFWYRLFHSKNCEEKR